MTPYYKLIVIYNAMWAIENFYLSYYEHDLDEFIGETIIIEDTLL